MSWLKIDDAFEDHGKVEPLSNDAHRLWMRAACWCRKPANEHTRGFVPKAMLRTIARNSASQSKLEKLARELENANAGGIYEHGLWEPVDGGWKFHDWDQYQPEPEAMKLTRTEAARLAGLRSAEVRRERTGSAQPRTPERPPNQTGTFEVGSTERRSSNAPNDDRTPVPVPVPIAKDTTTDPSLTGHARDPSSMAEALQWSVDRRAQFVVEKPHTADWLTPHKWPEIVEVAKAAELATGLVMSRLLSYASDRGVQRLVELFAAGYTLEQLLVSVRGDWFAKNRKGLAQLSRDVVARANAPTPDESAPRAIEVSAAEAAAWR